jgi:hypothetical protein
MLPGALEGMKAFTVASRAAVLRRRRREDATETQWRKLSPRERTSLPRRIGRRLRSPLP